MPERHKVVILGATYGSLLATKLLLGGHDVVLVCLPAEAELINREGTRVRMPVAGRDEPVEIDSRALDGTLSAQAPEDLDPAAHDLVVLAMQEPQYRAAPVRALLERVGTAGVPCMSIMNMPPLPYLSRIPGVSAEACRDCYADPTVWATPTSSRSAAPTRRPSARPASPRTSCSCGCRRTSRRRRSRPTRTRRSCAGSRPTSTPRASRSTAR